MNGRWRESFSIIWSLKKSVWQGNRKRRKLESAKVIFCYPQIVLWVGSSTMPWLCKILEWFRLACVEGITTSVYVIMKPLKDFYLNNLWRAWHWYTKTFVRVIFLVSKFFRRREAQERRGWAESKAGCNCWEAETARKGIRREGTTAKRSTP